MKRLLKSYNHFWRCRVVEKYVVLYNLFYLVDKRKNCDLLGTVMQVIMLFVLKEKKNSFYYFNWDNCLKKVTASEKSTIVGCWHLSYCQRYIFHITDIFMVVVNHFMLVTAILLSVIFMIISWLLVGFLAERQKISSFQKTLNRKSSNLQTK